VLALVAAFLVVGVAASGVLQPAAALDRLTVRDFLNENNIQQGGCVDLAICFHQGSGDDEIEDIFNTEN